MSGGGSAGEVSFPTHMEDIHKEWFNYSSGAAAMTTDLHSVMETALATNPLDSLSYTDPATDIGEVETEYSSWNTLVDGLDESIDWGAIVDDVVAQVDTAGVLNDVDIATLISNALSSGQTNLEGAITKALEVADSNVIKDAVESFVKARRQDRQRLRTRFKAQMANVGAERASSYALGLALLEISFEQETSQYQTQLSIETYQQGIQFMAQILGQEISARLKVELAEKQSREQLLNAGIQQSLQYKEFIAEMTKQLVQVLAEVKRIGFVMDSEYTGNTADLNWKHSSWDMNVYKNGVSILGGMGGGQFVPDAPSKTASAIGGAIQGIGSAAATSGALAAAGQGAAAGAVGGPVGLAAGAVLGLGAALL